MKRFALFFALIICVLSVFGCSERGDDTVTAEAGYNFRTVFNITEYDGNLYYAVWSEQNAGGSAIYKRSTPDSAEQLVYSSDEGIYGGSLCIYDDIMYFVENGKLVSVDTDGKMYAVIADDFASCRYMNGWLYGMDTELNTLRRVRPDGNDLEEVIETCGYPSMPGISGGKIYYSEDESLYCKDPDTGKTEKIRTLDENISTSHFCIYKERIYYILCVGKGRGGCAELHSCKLSGRDDRVIADGVQGYSIKDDTIYFATENGIYTTGTRKASKLCELIRFEDPIVSVSLYIESVVMVSDAFAYYTYDTKAAPSSISVDARLLYFVTSEGNKYLLGYKTGIC